jgi:inosine/xanthosine triphosphatase
VTDLSVAVGSLRAPKLNAVRAALEACKPHLQPGAELDIVGFDVPSGVRATPLSREETMRGARLRVEALRQATKADPRPWEYFVGLEGGIDPVTIEGQCRVFLESWVYVENAAGSGQYGQSGAIALPEELVRSVVDEGTDLSEAIDAFAGARGIRNGLGAWGVLTRCLITREDAFRIAAINSFAPFFQRQSRAADP